MASWLVYISFLRKLILESYMENLIMGALDIKKESIIFEK